MRVVGPASVMFRRVGAGVASPAQSRIAPSRDKFSSEETTELGYVELIGLNRRSWFMIPMLKFGLEVNLMAVPDADAPESLSEVHLR
jgi:hypothetical protein